ncbi:MAG: hypothetical protein WBQ21_10000, partial [Solirubrobacteraceae bacterium]
MKTMILKFKKSALFAGALFCALGIATSRADTLVTFSVDMGTNIANATFVPGTDTISVHGTFNGWGTGANLILDGDAAS